MFEKNKDRRILVILHLFYPASWKEIREYLLNLEGYNWDLYVTYPEMLEGKLDTESILQVNPGTHFLKSENKGYDIGPFLMALKQIDLSEYDAVFKLQSKGVRRKHIFIYRQLFFGRDWFLNLYEGIVGAGAVHTTIDRILNDPETGMISAENLIVHDPVHKENLVNQKLRELGLPGMEQYFFVAGTCFACKPQCLLKFRQFPAQLSDFMPVLSSRGLSLAHVMERYMCMQVEAEGYRFDSNDVCRLRRAWKRPLEKWLNAMSSERLHELPYHIDDTYFLWRLDNRFIKHRIKKIRLRDLKYQFGPGEKIIPLENCCPYRYLTGDGAAYDEYCRLHEEKGYPAMTKERFSDLIRSFEEKGYDPKEILIVNELNLIKDGQHRACCLAKKYGLDYEIDVLEIRIIDREYLIKSLAPRFVLSEYYRKKYGLDY